jgi:sterol desaturase/sphingolipid hydroxylase (fatty acid hydroxylase superfamily)
MYTLLKSEVGSFPLPHFPRGIDLNAEEHKARRRLYPVTVIYSIQFVTLLVLAARSHHLEAALSFMALGIVSWTPIEYLSHRYVLHGVFPKRGLLGRALHYLFDASHADHHARPWDGMYINGHLATLWLALAVMPLTLLAQPHAASVFVATVLLCYVFEEWVHHSFHFWNFRWSYFQRMRRLHLHHHSPRGANLSYGVTVTLWDALLRTQLPLQERELLERGLRKSEWRMLGAPSPKSAAGGA